MSALKLEAYEMLKEKFGQREANLFVEYIENKVEKEVEIKNKTLATNKDLILTKEVLFNEIVNVRGSITSEIASVRGLIASEIASVRGLIANEIASVRGLIANEIASVRAEVSTVKADLNKTIYIVGLIQFLAIVGSVLAIVNFMLK